MKLRVLQHNFQSWVLRVVEEAAAKFSVQNPCLPLSRFSLHDGPRTPIQRAGQRGGKKKKKKWVSSTQSKSLAVKSYFYTSCLLPRRLRAGISDDVTSCPLVLPSDWLFRSHPTVDRSRSRRRAAERMLRCLQQRRASVCPWARGRGREDAAGAQRITPPIAALCHTHTLHRMNVYPQYRTRWG